MKPDDPSHLKTSKSAITEYYDDLLGSLENDPLKKLVQEQQRAAESKNRHILPSGKSSIEAKSELALQKKKKPTPESQPVFCEESLRTEIVSPLIIPAAFPKMAPRAEKLPPQSKDTPRVEAIPEKVVTETPVKPIPLEKSDLLAPRTSVKASDPDDTPQKTQINSQKPVSSTPESRVVEQRPSNNQDGQKVDTSGESGISPETYKLPEKGILKNWLENGRPVWAQSRFECLLFTVAGLKLAVPLISLGAVYKIEKEITPLVGRADWFMGLYRQQDRNIRLVDTAQWVMPDRASQEIKDGYKFIIRLGGNDWGMACDAIHEAIRLEPSQVKWRTERSKRAWLSGTVIEHMCALLDADTLCHLLQQEDVS